MPGTTVSMGLKMPHSAMSGLRSNVSVCGGPPSIHSTMQFLALAFEEAPLSAARAASAGNQPESDVAATPAADKCSHSRRRKGTLQSGRHMVDSPALRFVGRSVVLRSYPDSAWERTAFEAPPHFNLAGRACCAVGSQAEPGYQGSGFVDQ